MASTESREDGGFTQSRNQEGLVTSCFAGDSPRIRKIFKVILIVLCASPLLAHAVDSLSPIRLCSDGGAGRFPLVENGKAAPLVCSKQDAEVVAIAQRALAADIKAVTRIEPVVVSGDEPLPKGPCLMAGTLGHSPVIDQLVKNGNLDVKSIAGGWERFVIARVSNPAPEIPEAVVIVGSDRRGTAYGIFEISRIIGISPWIWWADVAPAPRAQLFLEGQQVVSQPPAIKYRGIFLNDEDFGLHPWAAKHMDTDIKDIGPNTYARICELLLRLRANLLWPAMHRCTKAFYFYPENPKTTDRYGIVIGSSHCEPMLRDNLFEWKNFENEYHQKPDGYRYDTNKEQVSRYWADRVKQSARYESLYSLGMRGIDDGPMEGPANVQERVTLLGQIIADQIQMLKEIKRPEIPAYLCPYKEVLDLYHKGLQVPDDIPLVWPDDNFGYIRRLSSPEERKRRGGSGLYYHLSYWGAGLDTLWLCSTGPEKLAFELHKALQTGADRILVLNVGDLKRREMEMEAALDLAWTPSSLTLENAHDYCRKWAARAFGPAVGDEIGAMKNEYYLLAQTGRPEHVYNVEYTQNEAEERLKRYADLGKRAQALASKIPPSLQDAYFELILYPVIGSWKMNEKVLFAKLNRMEEAKAAYEEIIALTDRYNSKIANGKWDGMTSWNPRSKLPPFSAPEYFVTGTDSPPLAKKELTGVDLLRFSEKHDVPGVKIQSVPGLGAANGITRVPIISSTFVPEEAPFVEYKMATSPSARTIRVRFLPLHPACNGNKLTVELTLSGNSPQIFDLEAGEYSGRWKKNIVRGFTEALIPLKSVHPEQTTLKIAFPDPGVVLTGIVIE